MPHATRDDLSLYFEVHGHGRPVVLLHGITVTFAGNYAAFGWVEKLTAQGFQVIGLDFRGHGRSDRPHDPAAYSTAQLAADVLAVLDELGIAEASLVGYSLGSIVALHLLHRHPQRFGRSVLIATGDGLLGLPPYDAAQVMPALRAAVERPDYPFDLPTHIATYWTFAAKVSRDLKAAAAAASGDYPACTLDEAARVRAPVLVISGEKDPVLGQGPRLAQALPQGHYLEIAGADHFVLCRDEGAQTAVADFLAAS